MPHSLGVNGIAGRYYQITWQRDILLRYGRRAVRRRSGLGSERVGMRGSTQQSGGGDRQTHQKGWFFRLFHCLKVTLTHSEVNKKRSTHVVDLLNVTTL